MENSGDDVVLDDVPAILEKGADEAVGTGRLNRGEGENSVPNLRLAEGGIQVRKVVRGVAQTIPVEAKESGGLLPKIFKI
jgi:hypothetical protein